MDTQFGLRNCTRFGYGTVIPLGFRTGHLIRIPNGRLPLRANAGAFDWRMGQHGPVLGHEGGTFRQKHIRTPSQRRLAGLVRRRDPHGVLVGARL